MKIKKKSIWKDCATGEVVKVSRLRKKEVCFYPKSGGGKERKLERDDFLKKYEEHLENRNTRGYLKNIDADIMELRHGDLTRFSDESVFKAKCPVCEDGILLVCRDQETFELLEFDHCIVCGQRVRYIDIEEMQKKLG